MFENIKKEYRSSLKEVKFNKFYWINAIFASIVSLIIAKLFNRSLSIFFCYTYIIISLIVYSHKDYKKALGKSKEKNVIKRFKIYMDCLCENRIDNVLSILSNYNFRTKNDLKLGIDYYNKEQPTKIESSFLGWVVSLALTLASFIEIAYDDSTQTLNFNKLTTILDSVSIYVALIVIPIIVLKFLMNTIFIPKKEIYSQLSDDMSYIYINFNKYKHKLSKKSN